MPKVDHLTVINTIIMEAVFEAKDYILKENLWLLREILLANC